MYFFTTIEFYIILAVVAAAIVAFSARPAERGAVQEFLIAGDLTWVETHRDSKIALHCHDNGWLEIVRSGLPDIAYDGAVSIACKLIGHDLLIEERIVTGHTAPIPYPEARFTLKHLPEGRYHVRYNSQSTGCFTAFPLHVSPGISTTKVLGQ